MSKTNKKQTSVSLFTSCLRFFPHEEGRSPLVQVYRDVSTYCICVCVRVHVVRLAGKSSEHSCSAGQQFIPHHTLSQRKSASSNWICPTYPQQLCWLKGNGIQCKIERERETSSHTGRRTRYVSGKKSHAFESVTSFVDAGCKIHVKKNRGIISIQAI